jgi:ferredoxin
MPLMFSLSQKIIAVLFALWLPLLTGSALASSVAMSVPSGQMSAEHCQDEAMADMDMSAAADQAAPACASCGLCHLACTAYFAVATVALNVSQPAALDNTPYLVSFHSVSSTPLLPPPLARA